MQSYILIKDILKITNGIQILGDKNIRCENFCIDTRKIQKDDIFVAIKGKSFDGNIFWKEAFEKGAIAAIINEDTIINEKELEKYKNKALIKVLDTTKAIQRIAKYKRKLYNIPVIAVTGSVGKTSTRDMIASVVSQKYKTLKTEGNQNNEIGLPFSILKLKDHEALVLEMGMNHLNEISLLSKIAEPTLSVITNIGTAHIGNLGSRENILKAKLEILDGMSKKKIIINNDNDLLHIWNVENNNEYNIITFGIENKSDNMAIDIKENAEYSEFTCLYGDKKYKIKVPISGKNFIYNALCAISVGHELNISESDIAKGILEFELTKKRMEIIKTGNNITIINDSYNASYESMKAALEYLGKVDSKRKIAVLGDMFELGKFSEKLHRDVGKEVAKNSVNILVCSGKNSKYIIKEAEKNGFSEDNIYYKESNDEIIKWLNKNMQEGDTILIKASNGMKFFDIVNSLLNNKEE